jgi:hypothetical protein
MTLTATADAALTPQIEIRPRTTTLPAAQRREAVEILAAAFDANPLFRSAFPDDATRSKILLTLYSILLDDALRWGRVAVAYNHRMLGLLTWYPPGYYPMSAGRILRHLPDYLRMVWLSPTGMLKLFRDQATLNRLRPTQSHCHGSVLGGRPGGQVGNVLMRCMLRHADENGWPLYLETQDARAVKLHSRLGFATVHGGFETIPGGPPTWTMWREPHAKGRRSVSRNSNPAP